MNAGKGLARRRAYPEMITIAALPGKKRFFGLSRRLNLRDQQARANDKNAQ